MAAAAGIALEEGLEKITLRAVAERLKVRPGLITHYFPAAEELVVEAFARAALQERERFFPSGDTPLDRLAHFIAHIERGESVPLAKLWLNARHLSRFSTTLNNALDEQDILDRERLISLIEDAISRGDVAPLDTELACTRIFLAVDGLGSYVNSTGEVGHVKGAHFLSDVVEWALQLPAGSLRA